MGMGKEFKTFITRGNMMDLAVGVIVGGAFNGIITSFVNNIIMPVISLFTGKIDFENLFVALDGNKYATLAEAQEAGTSVLAYGSFITAIINFVILALVVFFLVKGVNKLKESTAKKEEPAAPTTKICPFCKSEIDITATRCPHCTSELPEEEATT